METQGRCQSCGMRIEPGFFGTLRDGSDATEYCKFCFQSGAFTDPTMTLDHMIDLSIENMTKELSMPLEKAEALAREYLPTLSRWRS